MKMKTTQAELTSYIKYNCPYCSEEDSALVEASEITNLDFENAEIKIECPFCLEIFMIDKIVD